MIKNIAIVVFGVVLWLPAMAANPAGTAIAFLGFGLLMVSGMFTASDIKKGRRPCRP